MRRLMVISSLIVFFISLSWLIGAWWDSSDKQETAPLMDFLVKTGLKKPVNPWGNAPFSPGPFNKSLSKVHGVHQSYVESASFSGKKLNILYKIRLTDRYHGSLLFCLQCCVRIEVFFWDEKSNLIPEKNRQGATLHKDEDFFYQRKEWLVSSFDVEVPQEAKYFTVELGGLKTNKMEIPNGNK